LVLACWPGAERESEAAKLLRALLVFSVLVALYLVYFGIGSFAGLLLWPAAVLTLGRGDRSCSAVVQRRINTLIAGGVLTLAAALTASPALAAQDYPSRPLQELARRPFWTTRRDCSFWTARRCRSFWTSAGRSRPAGRLLRWRPLPDLS